MTAIGVGMLWLSWWLGLSGYSMIRGFNNSPLQMANPVNVPKFTTQCYTGSGVWPTGDPNDSGTCTAPAGSKNAPVDQTKYTPAPNHICAPGYQYNPATKKCELVSPVGRRL